MSARAILDGLTGRDIVLSLDAGRLRYSAPPGALTDDDREAIRAHRPALVALLAGAEQESVGHCPACGSPSWWRAPSSPTWRCSYCAPRPQPLPEGFESLTLAGGRWRAGTAPPADPDDEPAPAVRPADGRVQDCYGAWRTPDQHERITTFYAHHWRCAVCRRAGRGYANRCAEGERLHELTKGKPT